MDGDIVARCEPRTHGRSGEVEAQIAILDRNIAVSLRDAPGERQRHASEWCDRRLRGRGKLQAALEGVAVEEIEESFIGLILDVGRMKMNSDPHCPILDNKAISLLQADIEFKLEIPVYRTKRRIYNLFLRPQLCRIILQIRITLFFFGIKIMVHLFQY